MLVATRRRDRRIRTPNEDAGRISGGSRIESDQRGPIHILECDMTGLVANRVRIDLGRSQTMEETHGKEVPEQRERSGVMSVQNLAAFDVSQPARDTRQRLLPRDRLEPALPLHPDAAKRPGQPSPRVDEGTAV